MKFYEDTLSGFGKDPRVKCKVIAPNEFKQLPELVNGETIIPRGLGRSYGDASINENNFVLSSTLLNKFISFDEAKGILHCESGVSYEDILNAFVHRGWFPAVTPGTKYVTMGGAAASDVHGKNHHNEGGFSNFLLSFKIVLANGEMKHCSRQDNSHLFWATVGGMGLTGFITEVEIQLKKIETPFINHKAIKVNNIEKLFEEFEKHDDDFIYSVAWVNISAKGRSLGKSLLLLGNHASEKELPSSFAKKKINLEKKLPVPLELPSFTLNNLSIGIFNSLYYMFSSNKNKFIHYDKFFYPLDSIMNWNNVYGKRGFLQYQFIISPEHGLEAMKKILNKLIEHNAFSFLSVLKKMSDQKGLLSFPFRGYTLAMDFPKTEKVLLMCKELDKIVLYYGGRTYLTKDSTLDEPTFKKMYDGNWQEWIELKKKYDPKNRFNSNLARRVGLCLS